MPAVATNFQQSIRRSPNTQEQKQHNRIFVGKQKQLMRQNLAGKSKEELAAEKEIIPRETIVAAGTTEEQPDNVKGKPQSQAAQEEIQKYSEHSHLTERDCEIYQTGNETKFFENNTLESTRTVADICLVNDHFILVKMPEESISIYRNKSNESATNRKNIRNLKGSIKYQRESRKMSCCCLRNKRNRITKIAPIHEEPEDLSEDEEGVKSKSNCLQINSCWQSNGQEVEMYQTKTKIYKNFPNTATTLKKQSSLAQPSNEKTQRLNPKEASDIPTISGSLLKSSLQYKVALHQFGSLHDSQNKDNKTLNQMEMINRTRHRKCPRLESFYWLLRPFRRKCRNPEPKIQAIVYKTYFVTWTKPPDVLAHGYGAVNPIKPSSVGKTVLRRCRSALF